MTMTIKKQCDTLLFAMLGDKDLVKRWWDSPNKAFDSRCPETVFLETPQLVLNYIRGCSDGYW